MKKLINEKSILIYALFFLAFHCCTEVKEKNNDSTTISSEKAFSIFQTQYLLMPDTVYLPNFAGYMAAENDDVLLVLKSFGGTWQEQYKYEIYAVQETIQDVDWIIIDSIPYIYIEIEGSGNMMGGVYLNLISLEDNKKYSISFDGYIGEYDHMSPISDELKNQKSILAYLEKKVAQSKVVYHPTKEDLDIDNPKNYAEKWRIENKNIYERLKLSKGPLIITFPYYESNLFNDVGYGSPNCSKENEMYIIKSYFKANVIGYIKKNKKYFVVWIPEFKYDHIQFIEFKTSNIILLKNDFEEYEINIANQSITGIKLNEW